MTTTDLALLLPIARDMTASLSGADRLRNLVQAVHRALPCDAVALLRVDGTALVPVAQRGLVEDVLGRRFQLGDHPRLDIICSGEGPTLFPGDSDLPDPYDGLVQSMPHIGATVHACLGCPLRVEGELVGVLTADALEPGAFDAIPREFLQHLAALAGAALRTSDLIDALERSAERKGDLARDLVRESLERRGSILIGNSPRSNRLREEIALVARSDYPVLITGETGVGKELVVRTLHGQSRRADQPIIYLNCAALPESVAESELFGHTRGAFTGAGEARAGKFGVADGATLFLDEIGELPLHVQPKLLRVLQEGEIQPVGADRTQRVDVRVLAATNRDLEAEVRAGRFRADLLHRLDVVRIRVPALAEHPEDIAALAGHFADLTRQRLGTGPIRYEPEALAALESASWPGNVRELENVVSRAILRAAARSRADEAVRVRAADLDVREAGEPSSSVAAAEPPRLAAGEREQGALRKACQEASERGQSLSEAQRDHKRVLVALALDRAQGNASEAARSLGVDRSNLHRLMRGLGLR